MGAAAVAAVAGVPVCDDGAIVLGLCVIDNAGAVVVGNDETVNVKVACDVLTEFVAVIVKVVAPCADEGVPVSRPVVVSKDIPDGADGEIENDAITPPELLKVYRLDAFAPTEIVAEDDESAIAGAMLLTVRENVRV